MIRLRDLSKIYKEGLIKQVVLERVSAEFSHGEMIILLGKSGSGKSTLLNLISGIDLPTSGDIIIDGKNLTKFSEQDRTIFRRHHIGFVFQFFNLIPTLTVEENLVLPLELKLNGRLSGDNTKMVHQLLEEVGLTRKATAFPDRLSGGEQQRVAIARALIHDPDIILADEPTGNLDYETALQIIDLLDRMVRQRGKTMLMATHSQEVIGLADRIFCIKDGMFEQTDAGKSC